MATVSVRYIVDDVEKAISFYTRHLGFGVEMHPAPGFASLSRSDLARGMIAVKKRWWWFGRLLPDNGRVEELGRMAEDDRGRP
jgi:hypothetical protein